jgi:hypothetical protein
VKKDEVWRWVESKEALEHLTLASKGDVPIMSVVISRRDGDFPRRRLGREYGRFYSAGEHHHIFYSLTSIKNAVSVLRSQETDPWDHSLCGEGVCFTATVPQLEENENGYGVILQAQIRLGRVMKVNKSRLANPEAWNDIYDRDGYDSVQIEGKQGADEFIVFDAGRVTNIVLHSALRYLYTGTLQGSADGTAKPGCTLENRLVWIVTIHPARGSPYPVLLGDDDSPDLGWAAPEELSLL